MNTKATKLNTKEISPLDYIRKKIKEEIKKGGFTYQSFSELFNKTEGWISNIVNAKRRITIDLIYEISKKLNISPYSLLPEEKNPKSKISFDEYIWFAIKEKLDKYFDEKLKKIK